MSFCRGRAFFNVNVNWSWFNQLIIKWLLGVFLGSFYMFFLGNFDTHYPSQKLLSITRIKDDDDRRLDGQLGRWPHVDGESVLATVALSVISAFIEIVIILIIDIIITVVVIISLSPLPSSAQILLRLDFSAFMCLVLGSLCCMWLLHTLGGTHYWDGQVEIIRFFVQQKKKLKMKILSSFSPFNSRLFTIATGELVQELDCRGSQMGNEVMTDDN